jgi:hypothetical protein
LKPFRRESFGFVGVVKLEISAPQCPNHYSLAGNCDILDTVVYQNIKLSGVIVSDILDSDQLPIALRILDHVKTKDLSEPVRKIYKFRTFKALPLTQYHPE